MRYTDAIKMVMVKFPGNDVIMDPSYTPKCSWGNMFTSKILRSEIFILTKS
uniref:Uncharacterized protein n=1 Tax=Anguilla anguilla TaxID=7936 RepID=A0A0E9VQZ0_ANGAN